MAILNTGYMSLFKQQKNGNLRYKTFVLPFKAVPKCNSTCSLEAVITQSLVSHPNASACLNTTLSNSPSEALPMACCNVGKHDTWHKGNQVQNIKCH